MNKDLLIIDGSSLLSTSYYATIPKSVQFAKTTEEKERHFNEIMQCDGFYTNALLGFFRAVHEFIDKCNPKYMAIVLDVSRNTFRRQIYPLYKDNRAGIDYPLRQQANTLQEILKDTGFILEKTPEFEGDDLAGSLAEKYWENAAIKIFTKDRDYFQLVDDKKNIRLWLYITDNKKAETIRKGYTSIYGLKEYPLPDRIFEFTEETVKDYYGVSPKNVVDRKAIEGDTSDNIPGIKGIGEKTIIPLINEYNTIERIYEDIDEVYGDDKKEKELKAFWKSLGVSKTSLEPFIEQRDSAFISKELSHIKTDCPISHSLKDMDVENIDYKKLKEWYEKLKMQSLYKYCE